MTRTRKPTVPAARAISRPIAKCNTDIRAAVCSTPTPNTGSHPDTATRQEDAPIASARRLSGWISMYATIAPTHRDSGMKYGAKPVP